MNKEYRKAGRELDKSIFSSGKRELLILRKKQFIIDGIMTTPDFRPSVPLPVPSSCIPAFLIAFSSGERGIMNKEYRKAGRDGGTPHFSG